MQPTDEPRRHEDGDEPGAEVKRLLESVEVPEARPEFRARLRERFLTAETEGELDDEHALEEPTPELARALDSLEPPAASAGFRSELRERFVSASEPVVRRPRPTPVPDAARGRSRRWRVLAGGLVAAAAAILVFFWPRGGPGWAVVPGSYVAEAVLVDGNPMTGVPIARFNELLARARTVETTDGELRMTLGEQFVVGLGTDTKLDLTTVVPDEKADPWLLRGVEGSFRIATGPAFDASVRGLRFETVDVVVEATGTIFGVDVYEFGTCVCCCEGQVQTLPAEPGGRERTVDERRLNIVFNDERPVMEGDSPADHMEPLLALVGFWP